MESIARRAAVSCLVLVWFGLGAAWAQDGECEASSEQEGHGDCGTVSAAALGAAANQLTSSLFPQNETTVAVDPTNPLRVLVGFNEYRPRNQGTNEPTLGAALSIDCGETWMDLGPVLDLPAGFDRKGADPGVCYDSAGRAYFGHIAFGSGVAFQRNSGAFVSRSDDGGLTWNATVPVASATSGGAAIPFEDKTLIAADEYASSPYTDRVYLSWTRFYSRTVAHPNPFPGTTTTTYGGGDIVVSYSDDHGQTWSTPYRVTNATNQPRNRGPLTSPASPSLDQVTSFVSGSEPEVAPNGDVYVAYWFGGRIEVHRSTDGGATFGPALRPFVYASDPVAATDPGVNAYFQTANMGLGNPRRLPNQTHRVNAYPNIECDPTRPGNVYVVAADDPDGRGIGPDPFVGAGTDGGDIVFARSTDHGATWEPVLTLNDDGLGNHQFFPWMAVDRDTGDIAVIWYDTRNDPTQNDLDVYCTVSTDGGVTFGPNQRLTDATFDPDTGQFPGNDFFGDYNGLAAGGGVFHGAWCDATTGEQEIFHRTKTTDQTPPVVSITSPADGTIVGTTSVFVTATVTEATAPEIESFPPGIAGGLTPGGGSIGGTIVLDLEGDNLIAVTATDKAGNVGADSITVIRDTLAPSITVQSPAQGAVFGMSPVSVSINVEDATDAVLEFGANSFLMPATVGGTTAAGSVDLIEGENTIVITATDAAGNESTTQLTLVLDLTAPIVTIDSPADGSCYGPGESPIAVSATVDDLTETAVDSTPAGVSGSLPDGGGVVAGAAALVEGSNLIEVSATDETGLRGSDSILVILDTLPPSATIDSPVAAAVVRGTIDFDATASDPLPGSGVAQVDFRADGTLQTTLAAGPYETSFDTTLLADGSHELSVVAVDGKGNEGAPAAVTVLVDNTPPVIDITSLVDGQVVSGILTLAANVTDATSGVASIKLFSDGAVVASDVNSVDIDTSLLANGPLTLRVQATDVAGNLAYQEITVQVDNLAPEKTLFTPSSGSIVAGVIDIVAEAEDEFLNSISIQIVGVGEIASSSTSPLSVAFDTTTVLDGELEIKVVIDDLGGNMSMCTNLVTVDNMSFRLTPRTLNMKSKGKNRSVTAHLEGPNLGLLLPVEDHQIHLEIPGGNPVPVTVDDYVVDDDELTLKFDRQAVICAINAGKACSKISGDRVWITLVVDGQEIGRSRIRFLHFKGFGGLDW